MINSKVVDINFEYKTTKIVKEEKSMKGHKVLHKVFGEGIITNVEGDHIIISFPVGEKTFTYPDSFKNFLVAKDSAVIANIEAELNRKEELNKREQLEKDMAVVSVTQKAYDNIKKSSKVYPRENIAFKCNYCDGGKNKDRIGFHGVCSDAIIKYNIESAHHVWCCADECPCRQYHDSEISRFELEQIMSLENNSGFVCYESSMLRDWRAAAGIIQTGENKGRPMHLMKVQPNSLAVLTTRDPRSTDDERFIFAVFLIDETYEGDNRDEGYVTTQSEFRIQMTLVEAHKLKFWNYYFNRNAPELVKFGSGLHRYLSNEQAAQILRDIMSIKNGTSDESLAMRFFKHFCRINAIDMAKIPLPYGVLKQFTLKEDYL